MEEESLCCSLFNNTALQQPEQDSGSLVTNQYINGEHETIVWGETEMQIKQSHGTDQPNLPQDAGRESPEEAEQWEQMPWPTRPTLRTSASLSFATVRWDMPGSYEEAPSLVTDCSLANELVCGGVTSVDSTPLSFHQFEDINAELFMPEETEERDEFEPRFLDVERKGNVFEPCDAEDVQTLTTQEKEETDDLLKIHSEISLRTDSEEEEEHSVTSGPPVDVINTLEEVEGSEDDRDSFVDVKLEEEQEEPEVLLTAQANPAEEQTSADGVEADDKNEEQCEVGGEQSCINVSCTEGSQELQTVGYLSDVDVPVEPLQTADTGLTLNSNNLQLEHLEENKLSGTEEDIEILEQIHEDSTGQTEDPEMCKDVDQHTEHEQSKTDDDEAGTLIEAAEPLQRIENTQERLELTGQAGETSCAEQQACNQTILEEKESLPVSECSESEQIQITKDSEQIEAEVSHQAEEEHSEDSELLGESQRLDQSPPPVTQLTELTEPSTQHENVDETEELDQSEEVPGVCFEAEEPEAADQQEHMETPTEQNKPSLQMADTHQPVVCEQPGQPQNTTEQELPEREVTQQTEEAELSQMDSAKPSGQTDDSVDTETGTVITIVVNGEQPKPLDTAVPHMNGGDVDREKAHLLAERLFNLDHIQRVDVVKHLDKDNNFSQAVGEEYLKFFDFSGQTLDQALRSFLKVVILIGETQERERVLQHFACRFHQCNPDNFSSSGAVLALTCAVMLLNTDLHGQHVGKSMSSSKFVSNLDGMNEGTNFSKDLLKSLYNSIKNEPLEWAVDDDELKSSVLPGEDTVDDGPMRSKANPFLDVPHDKNASVIKEGFLQRKLHADIDGKRTPWGKRGWKTFNAVLRGMVLYLQKNDYRREQLTYEEVVSVHHSLAEQAADYTKKPHVFRLQTADWRVFLFQASSQKEMNSWISRINLVSALHSSPPFPAAVGSQRKFFRPILPASQSAHTMERQLQSHTGMLESFKADLLHLQQNPPEGRKARTKDLEEHRIRAEYLQHEMSRYETYIQVLEAWTKVAKAGDTVLSPAQLLQFERDTCADTADEVDEAEGALKKSISSPSLAVELAPPIVIKVRRNISERRTQRRIIVPRRNKEA